MDSQAEQDKRIVEQLQLITAQEHCHYCGKRWPDHFNFDSQCCNFCHSQPLRA